MWYVEKESTPLLKLAHQSQTDAPDQSSDQSSEQTVGRPVYQVFKFEPRRAGDGILRMHYVRSWEKPTPDDEQFQIHVVIE
jgi:predicted secreted protein